MRAKKDSGIEWIGQIPQEWDIRKIKHCFNVYAGATPKSGNSEFWDGDIVWVTPADYTTEQKYVSEGRKRITSEGFESCSTEMIPAGSLIFSKRAPIGLVAINTVDLCTNQGCLSCVPFDENDVEYFYYALSCFSEQFDLYGSGTTFKEISADAFVNFPIPCPDFKTQQDISEYLRGRCAEIDALITAKEKTNALLRERRQSIIYEAVTKGLNPDAPMKDSGIEWIGMIPESWDVVRIKHLRNREENSFEDGDWIEAPSISETGIRYLTTGNIGDGNYKEQGNGFVTQETFDALKCKYAYPGDLVFSRLNAPYGRSCILPNHYPEYVLAVDNVILRTDCCKKFLCYLTQCTGYQRVVEEKANGTTMKRISRTNLGDIALPIPTLEEQEAIAMYLDTECVATDSVISANEETIQKLKEYRQSIIYEAVTGKIEI